MFRYTVLTVNDEKQGYTVEQWGKTWTLLRHKEHFLTNIVQAVLVSIKQENNKWMSRVSSYRWQARWAGGGLVPVCGPVVFHQSCPQSWEWTWSPRHLRSSLAPRPPYTGSTDLRGKRGRESSVRLIVFGGSFYPEPLTLPKEYMVSELGLKCQTLGKWF